MQALLKLTIKLSRQTNGSKTDRARFNTGWSDMATSANFSVCLTACLIIIGVTWYGFAVPWFTGSSNRVLMGLGYGIWIRVGPSNWPLCDGITISISRLSAYGVGLGRAWAWGAESSKVPGAVEAVSRGQPKVLWRLVSMHQRELRLRLNLKILPTGIQADPPSIRVTRWDWCSDWP